ncbi:hypothetical protein AB0F72_09210 [Actinoplanes sp. NPDC023936]|uniref:hypothetical protein n=1 Tax=Actinoplanes sp. NPDC023936 TaxID=3154910 RepID=UPI00340313FB
MTIENIPLPGMPEPVWTVNTVLDLPAGIVQSPQPCWHLVDAADAPYVPGDTMPHYDTQVDAASVAEGLTEHDDAPFVPAAFPHGCWTAVAACGLVLDSEEGGSAHFDGPDLALSEAAEAAWTVVGGVLRCEDGEDCKPKGAA